MDISDVKRLSSLLGSLKGTIINNLKPDEYDMFVKWCNKLALDSSKDKKEKDLLKQINSETDKINKQALINERKKYYPKNYPKNISIGDVVYINFGYGYCSEMTYGHYGIIMSDVKANMYFIIPCSSEPFRILKYPIQLGVPNKENNPNKVSYVRFDQMRMIHYRRIEKVKGNKQYNIGNDAVNDIKEKICEFLNISIDNDIK